MTNPGPALEKLPHWPQGLNQQQAAAYLGVSTGTFAKELRAGVWPAPIQIAERRRKVWNRKALDAAFDRLCGLSAGTADEEIGNGRDPGYFKRRLEAVCGDEEHPAPRLSKGRG